MEHLNIAFKFGSPVIHRTDGHEFHGYVTAIFVHRKTQNVLYVIENGDGKLKIGSNNTLTLIEEAPDLVGAEGSSRTLGGLP